MWDLFLGANTRTAQEGAAAGRTNAGNVARVSSDATGYAAQPQDDGERWGVDFLGTLARVGRDILDGPDRGPQPVVVEVQQAPAPSLPSWVPLTLAVGAGVALAVVVRGK